MNEFSIGTLNPIQVKIPFIVYHGFTAVVNSMAMIVNFPTEFYDYVGPNEYFLPYDYPFIPYKWEVRMG
jgi:dTDP-4-dehydrorhamnose 3,5-epimerase-like enzyme